MGKPTVVCGDDSSKSYSFVLLSCLNYLAESTVIKLCQSVWFFFLKKIVTLIKIIPKILKMSQTLLHLEHKLQLWLNVLLGYSKTIYDAAVPHIIFNWHALKMWDVLFS